MQDVVEKDINLRNMYITTSKNNIYSYIRETNEIVNGIVNDNDFKWIYTPLKSFTNMPEIDMFILSITEQCNLRCTYCCYSGEYLNNRSHGTKKMTSKDIDEIIKFIDKTSSKRPLLITFYGGEPLLQLKLIKYTIEKAREKWNNDVSFSISTNGTLLSYEIIEWFIKNNVRLAISLDGSASFHDKYRIDIKGNGTFSKIYKMLLYINENHPEYVHSILFMMTLPSFESLEQIAKEWNEDDLLKDISPTMINGLAPNFSKGVNVIEYEELKKQYLHLIDIYEKNPNWIVLKVFLNQCISYWKDRPILKVEGAVPMATCMPLNTKLYIDANLEIGVCEKFSDKYRIGNIKEGIDWDKANKIVQLYYDKRKEKCTLCSAVRMCDMCLTSVEYTDEQWDILCHNEQSYARIFMFVFCEMAERGLLT